MEKSQRAIRFYDFGPFRIDVAGRQLLRSGQLIPLTPKAFELLSVLVQNAGAIVDKQDLLNAVWPGVSVDEGILSVNIAAVRKALSEESAASNYIETVPRRGYKFVADVRRMRGDIPGKSRRLVLAATASVVALASLALWRWPFRTVSPLPLRVEPLTSYAGSEMKPSFSPDGSQVAFSWSGEQQDNYDIYVKVLNSGPALRLTRDPAADIAPAWSPDGRQIAFVRNRAVFLTSPIGGSERRLADVDAGHLAWSPDGHFIAANSSRHGIVLISSETGEIRPITSPGPSAVMGDLMFAFSSDGKSLAFARFPTATTADLYVLPQPLSSSHLRERRVFSLGQGVFGLTWTADGRELIYASGRGHFEASFYRLKIDGSSSSSPTPLIELGDGVAEPAMWAGTARRNSKLAFERRTFDQNIWKLGHLDTPGAKSARILASTRTDAHPRISPDGRRIAFTSDRSGRFQVWACNADGSNPAQVTFLPEEHVFSNAPRWSPNGELIAFASMARSNRDIYIAPVGGGRVRRFTDESSEEGRPSWSSDGRWIYYYSTQSGSMEIWKRSADGGRAIQVTQGGGHEAFESPGGERLFYTKPFGRGVWTVSPKGEKQTGEAIPGLEAVSDRVWAVVNAGIYFVDSGESVPFQPYDPRAVVLSLEAWSASSRMAIRFFDFSTRRVSQVTTIEANVTDGFHVLTNGSAAVWAQIDSSNSDLLLVEQFQ